MGRPKKRRTQIDPVPDDVYLDVGQNPIRVFPYLESLQASVPANAEFMLLCYKTTTPKFDIRTYVNQDDYLRDYTSCLLKGRDDYLFYSFRKDGDGWEMFLPPPVVGMGITTRLRPGLDEG